MVADVARLQQSRQKINQLGALLTRQRVTYLAQLVPDVIQCVQWLRTLHDLLFREQQVLIGAVGQDFNTHSTDETLPAEIIPGLYDIHYAAKRVKKRMKPAHHAVDL